jgi:tetratricopeptide (TPR) repeat protein
MARVADKLVAAALIGLAASPAEALDVDRLLDFSDPVRSEQRLRNVAQMTGGDNRLIVQTMVARTHGLRRDFATARNLLDAMRPQLAASNSEVQARHALELGRTLVSATHPPEQLTAEAREQARAAYLSAATTARNAGLDALAIDALHMMAFVDTAPADQLRWNREALALAESSTQPKARAWRASLRNNIGHALQQQGRKEEALAEFQRALALREQTRQQARPLRIAQWTVAWSLRSLSRLDEALAIQLQLEREWDAAGTPDPHVFDELALLYRAKGDETSAARYVERRRAFDAQAGKT